MKTWELRGLLKLMIEENFKLQSSNLKFALFEHVMK